MLRGLSSRVGGNLNGLWETMLLPSGLKAQFGGASCLPKNGQEEGQSSHWPSVVLPNGFNISLVKYVKKIFLTQPFNPTFCSCFVYFFKTHKFYHEKVH